MAGTTERVWRVIGSGSRGRRRVVDTSGFLLLPCHARDGGQLPAGRPPASCARATDVGATNGRQSPQNELISGEEEKAELQNIVLRVIFGSAILHCSRKKKEEQDCSTLAHQLVLQHGPVKIKIIVQEYMMTHIVGSIFIHK